MSYNVHIPTPLQPFTGGAEKIACEAATLPLLINELTTKFPGLRDRLCEPNGRPRRFLNVYINDEDIRFLGGDAYKFAAEDEVLILPAIAGG